MKIGKYTIPRYRLDTLLPATAKIYDQFKSEEVSTHDIAPILKLSATSGGFYQKMADLRAYGLIEGRKDKITVTELGKKATFGDADEKAEALGEVVRNIPLWSKFLSKYGNSIKPENFWVDLARITGLERPDSQKKAGFVRKAYLEDAQYIKSVGEPKKTLQNTSAYDFGTAGGIPNMQAQTTTVSEKARGIAASFDHKASIEITDEDSLEVAESILDLIRKKLRQEKEEEQTPKDDKSGNVENKEINDDGNSDEQS